MPIGHQVWPASLERMTPSGRRGHQRVPMRRHRHVIALAHHRATLPGSALVLAGEQSAAGCRQPRIAPEDRAHTRGRPFAHRLLHLSSPRSHALPRTILLTGFASGVGNGVSGLPEGRRRRVKMPLLVPASTVAIRRLRQGKHIAPVQPVGHLLPLGSAVGGDEHAAVVACRSPRRRRRAWDPAGRRAAPPPCARKTRDFRAQKLRRRRRCSSTPPRSVASSTRCGLRRVHVDVVDDHIGPGHAAESPPAVRGLVEPFGGSGVDDLAVLGILPQHARPARRPRECPGSCGTCNPPFSLL